MYCSKMACRKVKSLLLSNFFPRQYTTTFTKYPDVRQEHDQFVSVTGSCALSSVFCIEMQLLPKSQQKSDKGTSVCCSLHAALKNENH